MKSNSKTNHTSYTCISLIENYEECSRERGEFFVYFSERQLRLFMVMLKKSKQTAIQIKLIKNIDI